MRGLERRRRGSAAIEAALALPAMLVLFGAVSQMLITAQSRVHLEQAAYAAARSALVYKCPDFNLVAELKSVFAGLRPTECTQRRGQLNAAAQARALDAARWALIAAAPTTGSSAGRGCERVPAAEELLTGNDRIAGRDQAARNALCYVFEPGNVTVDLAWQSGLFPALTGSVDVPISATVTFRFPLSTPFRRFLQDEAGVGERGDGTFFMTRSATVTLL